MESEPTTFRRWQAEVKPILMSMMGALYFAQDATSRGPQALLSASDQLLAASNHAACWYRPTAARWPTSTACWPR